MQLFILQPYNYLCREEFSVPVVAFFKKTVAGPFYCTIHLHHIA